MNIEHTFFLKNWAFICDKFKKDLRINKGELLEGMGYNPTTDFQWRKRNTISKTTLRKIRLHVNREFGWNLKEDDLLEKDLSKENQFQVNELDQDYLIEKEKEILRIFRSASPEDQKQIYDYLQFLSRKKND